MFVQALLGMFVWTSTVNAQQSTVLAKRAEPWGLYCVEGPAKPSLNDCSLVTAVASKEDPDSAAKLAVAVVSPEGDMELTILVPKIRHVAPGVAISNGAGTLVRMPFDECLDGGCTSVARMDGSLLKKFLTGGHSWIEYQVSKDQTTRLALDFTSFGDAITALYQAVGIGSSDDTVRVASGVAPSTLAKVRVDIKREAIQITGAQRPATDRCQALLTGVTFTVSPGLKITDQKALDTWLKASRLCMQGAVAKVHTVSGSGTFSKDDSNIAQMQAYQVFDVLREKSGAGQVYLAGQSDVPMQPSER